MKNYKNYIFEKYKLGHKIQHDYVFSYVYGVKDSRSYDVNSAYGQNVATKLGRREYFMVGFVLS